MKLTERQQWAAREKAAKLTDEQVANILASHAVWYEEYTADGYDDDTDEATVSDLAFEAAVMYAAAVRLLKKAHADKQQP